MPSWLFAIRGNVPLWARWVLGALPIVLLVGWWWVMTAGPIEERRIGPAVLPSPGEVLRQLPVLFTSTFQGDNAVIHHVLASLRRIAIGFTIALVVAVPLGIVVGASAVMRAAFTPLITASGYLPIATLVPLSMTWWGLFEEQKCGFLGLAFAISMLPLVIKAIDGVPDVFVRTARTLGASRVQVVLRVLVPVAAPDLWHALRLAFGVGRTYLVLAETGSALVDGLGFVVAQGQRVGPRTNIYLAILIITAIAWLADLGWDRLGRLLFPYRAAR